MWRCMQKYKYVYTGNFIFIKILMLRSNIFSEKGVAIALSNDVYDTQRDFPIELLRHRIILLHFHIILK
jgi:hypothetical protein